MCTYTSLLQFTLSFLLIGCATSQVHTQNANPAIDYSELGNNTWWRFRPGWSLTVNDQCLYEFVFQFEHDDTLPIGPRAFEGDCSFKNPETKLPWVAPDGDYFLKPRRFYERFPSYVWETIGFNHLSIDWYPCGKRPTGYALPTYAFSFFRVTPEYRAETMVCEKADSSQQEIVAGLDDVCHDNPTDVKGKNFFIRPGALINRNPVVNSPESFTQLFTTSAVSGVGLKAMDERIPPQHANQWNDIVLYTSTYAGNLVNWEAHVPYRMVSGPEDIFTSSAAQYFESTIQSLPDTFAYDYDVSDGVIRFIMVGQSNLCRAQFEQAERAASGPPVFPNYDIEYDGYSEEGGGKKGRGRRSGARSNSMASFTLLFTLLLVLGALW